MVDDGKFPGAVVGVTHGDHVSLAALGTTESGGTEQCPSTPSCGSAPEPLDVLMRERQFEPLAMSHTGFVASPQHLVPSFTQGESGLVFFDDALDRRCWYSWPEHDVAAVLMAQVMPPSPALLDAFTNAAEATLKPS
jgi:hypothetical protein